MKIKTITCHDVYNHGAALQAYALTKYLRNIGHEAEIINYTPDYLLRYNLWLIGPKWKQKNILIRALYFLAKFPKRVMVRRAKRPFDLFKRRYMRLTAKRYRSCAELKNDPPSADAYIAGSDQIWNTLYVNGRDPAFYLDFAPARSRRIAYAASFSIPEVLPEYREFVKSMIERLDFVSVREASGIDTLRSLGIDKGTHVLDPVFLLDRAQWENIADKHIQAKYILVYQVGPNPLIERIATWMRQEKHVRIYAVQNHAKTGYADRDYYPCGPDTFLSLVRGAEAVLSNSFHATAFSILFERPFFVFERTDEDVNSRMLDLLEMSGLNDQLLRSEDDYRRMDPVWQYREVQARIAGHIARSKLYIDQALHSISDAGLHNKTKGSCCAGSTSVCE